MVNKELTLVKGVGGAAFSDSTWKGSSLTKNKEADKVYSVGINILRVALVTLVTATAIYALMCLVGSMTSYLADDDIWTVAQKMFSSIYESVKGIVGWAAVAGAVFCLLGIFFQRDEKAVAGRIKGLVAIGLAFVGVFVLPNIIATLTSMLSDAGVSATGLDGPGG